MFQNVKQTESQNTLCLQHCTVLYCIILSPELNDRHTVTEILNFQTVIGNESHNTQSLYSTILYCTVLLAEKNNRHNVRASLIFLTVTQTESHNSPSGQYCTVLRAEQSDRHILTEI